MDFFRMGQNQKISFWDYPTFMHNWCRNNLAYKLSIWRTNCVNSWQSAVTPWFNWRNKSSNDNQHLDVIKNNLSHYFSDLYSTLLVRKINKIEIFKVENQERFVPSHTKQATERKIFTWQTRIKTITYTSNMWATREKCRCTKKIQKS